MPKLNPKLGLKLGPKLVPKMEPQIGRFFKLHNSKIEAGKQRPPKQEKSTSHEANTLLIVSEC